MPTYPILQQVPANYAIYTATALDDSPVDTLKTSGGNVRGWHFYNPNAVVSYVQFFNVASVTLGTTTPYFVVGIPANGAATMPIGLGIPFSTYIRVAATTTPTGNTAPATAGVVAVIVYE